MPQLLAHMEALLRQLGPLTEEAWEALRAAARQRRYGADRAVHLEAGGMLYVGSGLLKQYARAGRTKPAIQAFLGRGEPYCCPHASDGAYLKSVLPSELWYWEGHALRQLMAGHPCLIALYMRLRDMQEERLDKRLLLLEARAKEKLALFNDLQPRTASFVKGRDLANHLNMDYTYLIHLRGK